MEDVRLPWPEVSIAMGYGNPLFDGDEPLPAQDPRQRIVSMRLWPGAARGAGPGEAAYSADRRENENADHHAEKLTTPHP